MNTDDTIMDRACPDTELRLTYCEAHAALDEYFSGLKLKGLERGSY